MASKRPRKATRRTRNKLSPEFWLQAVFGLARLILEAVMLSHRP